MTALNTEQAITAEEARLEALAQDYESRASTDPEGPESWTRYASALRETISRLRDDLRRGGYTIEARDDHCPERGFSPIGTCSTVQEFLHRYATSCGDMTYHLRDDYGDVLLQVIPMKNVGDRWLAEQSQEDCPQCRGTGKLPSERWTHDRCPCIKEDEDDSNQPA